MQMTGTVNEQTDSKTIRSFFDAIHGRYDCLNSILSFSLDGRWRKKLVAEAVEGKERSLLDIGCGTGRSLEAFVRAHRFDLAVGCDFSSGMLGVAKEKFTAAQLAGADLHSLPFRDGSFDLITSSFVLRSVRDMGQFLREVIRTMSRGGKFAFLELTRPTNAAFRKTFFKLYLEQYLPFVGRMVSKQPTAYQFLSESIQNFEEPAVLKERMERGGFSDVRFRSYSLGLITMFFGRKAASK